MVGVLSGVLGERVHRTRGDLERTARELDRVRIDNDVVLRHLTTGVFTVDHNGIVGYLNPAAEQVLGTRAIETRGRHVSYAMPERLGGCATSCWTRSSASADAPARNCTCRAPPGAICRWAFPRTCSCTKAG